jgi:hypothetical protein
MRQPMSCRKLPQMEVVEGELRRLRFGLDAGTEEPGSGWVQVATTGWPFGSGSLRWLIEASGGGDVVYGT